MPTYKYLSSAGKGFALPAAPRFADRFAHALFIHRKRVLQAAALCFVLVVVIGAAAFWWRSETRAAVKAYGELQLTLKDKSLDERINGYQTFREAHRRTPLGQIAAFEVGTFFFEKKEYAQALPFFRTLSQEGQQKPLLAVAALHMVGRCCVELGKYDDALQAFREAALLPGNLLAFESRYQQGLVLERQENYDEAQKVYQQIRGEASASEAQVKERSEERLLWLATR